MAENEVRSMSCVQSCLSRCDGSATFTHGNTSVLAAVHGPGEVRLNKELIDKASVEVVFKPSVGLPGCSERLCEDILCKTCETVILAGLYPRTSISIVVQVIEDHGSLLACCINSAIAALLDAAISMTKMITAVNCMIDERGDIFLDPDSTKSKSAVSTMTFAFDSVNFDVITVHTVGEFSSEQFFSCLTSCREASKGVFQFLKSSMVKKMSKND